jgi:hypothetical protein
MKAPALAALLVASCTPHDKPPRPPVALPAASTVCYAGTTTGNGEEARTILRRTVNPAAGTITEDASHGAESAHGATSFHVVETVTGDQYAMTEARGVFSGSGQLMGEPWKWNQWSSAQHLAKAPIEIDSDDELTDTGMKATKKILQDGKLVTTVVDELRAFDCAQWDAVKAALAVPPLDDAACKAACTNFATLKYWAKTDPANALTPEQRAASSDELAKQLEAKSPTCIAQCRSANDAVGTHCMATAPSVDALAACQ